MIAASLAGRRASQSYRKQTFILFGTIFLTAALFIAPLGWEQPNIFDEGFIVSGAMMVSRGWLPIRDLFVIYGPGQYYFIAALFELFGENLLTVRVTHILTLALVVASVGFCTRLTTNNKYYWPILTAIAALLMTSFTMPNAGYPAVPAVTLLFWSACGFIRWFSSRSLYYLIGSSFLLGITGLFRWDFGIFGMFSQLLTFYVVSKRMPMSTDSSATEVRCIIGPWLILTIFCFGSFVFIGGVQRWFEEVPKFSVLDFNTWRGINFIRPQVDALFDALSNTDRWATTQAATNLVFSISPFILASVALALSACRMLRGRAVITVSNVSAFLISLIALMLMNQMRVRPGHSQGYPAYMMCMPMIGYILSSVFLYEGISRIWKLILFVLSCVLFIALPLLAVKDHVYLSVFKRERSEIHLSKASFIYRSNNAKATRFWVGYEELVKYIQATTKADEPIFSGVADTSRLYMNDAMLYFLADRPSATRWVEIKPARLRTSCRAASSM